MGRAKRPTQLQQVTKMKTIKKTVPYHQWLEGFWDDYEVIGYEFLRGTLETPTGVEIKKVIEEETDDE